MERKRRELEKMVEAKKETLKAVFGDSYPKKQQDSVDAAEQQQEINIDPAAIEYDSDGNVLSPDKVMEKRFREQIRNLVKGIPYQARDVTAPKDKWKVGNALKALQADFKHDRVLERMIAEEFKTNQLFKYPEEYDLYDAEQEEAFKKGFKNKGA